MPRPTEGSGVSTLGPRIVAVVAALFGVATIAAGVRVLAGGDPGYVVYRPLVVFNTVMGAVYLAAAALAWRADARARAVAAAIVVLNVIVLAAIVYLFRSGAAVAVDSVRAMVFRSGVWLLLLAALAWMRGRSGNAGRRGFY